MNRFTKLSSIFTLPRNVIARGFTLIELLIVIGILAVLATVVVLVINPAQLFAQARDSRRLHDMQEIVSAIGHYQLATGDYNLQGTGEYGESEGGAVPPGAVGACASIGGWDSSACDWDGDGKFFAEFIQPYFGGDTPKDPTNDLTHQYLFYVYDAGYSDCDATNGKFYVLGIRDIETSSGVHESSPGWSCPLRDWQGEFEWVTGKFIGN